MAPKQKQESGTTTQNIAKAMGVKVKLIRCGTEAKIKAQIRIAFLYPTNLAKGFDSKTAKQIGINALKIITEFDFSSTLKPLFFS